MPQGITVLLSLTVFMLLVAEIMPATSDSVPLIGGLYLYVYVSMCNIGKSLLHMKEISGQAYRESPLGNNLKRIITIARQTLLISL